MSPVTGDYDRDDTSFPRVSGDEPIPTVLIGRLVAFSPRERG